MDARQRRSRERLHRAVLTLAQERPVATLSVTEVAAEAGVHRTTFYEHASSPFALLEQALVRELDEVRVRLLSPAEDLPVAIHEGTRMVLEHVKSHLGVYRQGLASDAGPSSLHAMLASHFMGSTRQLRSAGRARVVLDVPGVDAELTAEAAARFLADGTVGLIATWIATDELDVDAFVDVYAALTPQWWTDAVATPASA
ncbi:TetR/AcrR family transcriptional regulator [Nocardioides bruguierae]|uniref:TetR/AcrR family transcriptional regulator n=1 Tax=Nocardioides bruguierae TaxID=2945102 RepID=A0A9X2D776_9ACTN|nr:TetR/AcrR family transcriptional regulator [Nocardioides bruguierae]MCL8024035.1 TetR/AcrR family transcriptional regulator [Nocardioides bruguierae]MCM0620299.1 TetR/AcrR family transcriptional regulator [Nocardioides bruguierae]